MSSPSPELLVVRHAKSAWDAGVATDYERPLAPRGERDAPRVGRWLLERGLAPDYVVSSPARRAEQTTGLILDAMDLPDSLVHWDERVYHAALGTLLTVLDGVPREKRRVALVGHNPGLEELVDHLSGGGVDVPPNGKVMPTCAVAWFRDGALVEILRPRTLSG